MTDEDRRFLKGLYEHHPDSPKDADDYPDEEHTPLTETPAWIFEPSAGEPQTDEDWNEYHTELRTEEPMQTAPTLASNDAKVPRETQSVKGLT